jgi:signal transduction histidine kinase
VEVAADADAGWAVIDVTDDGPGMSPEYVATRLFRPFASNKHAGMGLGTYQVRETAREAGGDVEVITSEGSGTTMRMRLPLLPDDSGERTTTPGAAA